MRRTRSIIARLALTAFLSGLLTGICPARGCQGVKGVNILVMDNSRSVPNMDRTRDRVEVLKDLLGMLGGYENRLILFGGRNEIALDNPDKFVNDGWHTDYHYAFAAAARIRKEYPPDCDVKMIFITDGIMDAFPEDYPEEGIVSKAKAMDYAREQSYRILEENRTPLYIILLGGQYDAYFMEQLSIRANGLAKANPLVERAAEFLDNNGFLLKKFIYRMPENAGTQEFKKVFRKIAHEDKPRFEYGLLGLLALALAAFVIVSIRSFPAPGDREIIDLVEGVPVLIGAGHRNPGAFGGLSRARPKGGLQQVAETSHALASLSYQRRNFDFTSRGLQGITKLDAIAKRLLDMDIQMLGAKLDEMEKRGADEEIIAATDLKYYCSNLDAEKVKQILQAREMDRMDIQAADFLKAKVYVSMAPDLLEELTEHRVFLTIPNRNIIRSQLTPGQIYNLGRYRIKAAAVSKDSKYSARVTIEYLRVPSTLGLKNLIPPAVQRWIRLRRTITAFFTS
jgi:hypothetical protein